MARRDVPTPATRLAGIAYYVPDEVRTSTSIEEELGLRPGRIEALTGIRERRVAAHRLPSTLAYEASRRCLKNAGLEAGDIDAVLYAGLSRDLAEPATANILQDHLGIRAAFSFDITNACLGFINGLQVAQGLLASGQARRVLVAAAEGGFDPIALLSKNGTDTIPARHRFAHLTVGHAAAAAVVEEASNGEGARLVGIETSSHGQYWDLCTWKGPDSVCMTRMMELHRTATDLLVPATRRFLARIGWKPAEVDHVIPHQPAVRPVERAVLGAGLDLGRTHTTVREWGNTISCSIPATLAHAWERGLVQPGQRVLFGGAASGINVGLVALLG